MHFEIHMVFFFKLVLKLTLRKLDNNFEAAQRKIRRVKNTHPTYRHIIFKRVSLVFQFLKTEKKKMGWTDMYIK